METSHRITLELNLTRRKALVFLTLFFLCWRPGSLGSETLTMTTYYPAPYGGYARLLTTGQTVLARDAGSNVGIGTDSPVVKLDVRGTLDVRGGDIRMDGGGTIRSTGRMHITGEELLYLLNRSGVVIGREWGGNGNLQVQGSINMPTSGSAITGNNMRISGVCTDVRMNNTGWTWCPAGASVVNVGYDAWAQAYACFGERYGWANWPPYCISSRNWVGTTGWLRCCRIQ